MVKLLEDSSLHFVSLRMTDICVFEEEVVGGTAANHLLLPYTTLNTCHSERSEESHGFSLTVIEFIEKL
jgi:hypothetical protein